MSEQRVDVVVMGGGRMGAALIGGMLRSGMTADSLAVVETDSARRAELEVQLPGVAVVGSVDDLPSAPSEGDSSDATEGDAPGFVLAVKPGDAAAVCEQIAGQAARILSVMAGVSLTKLHQWSGSGVPVLRSMPNTPALVGAGISALVPGPSATTADVEWATTVLRSVGEVVHLTESSIDAVTGLSGSGPAYVMLVAESLIEAGVLNGLSRPVARRLAVHTLLGSAKLLLETDDEPAVLRAQVTSPGGTTAAGLRSLETNGVRSAFLEAVTAATDRSRQMGAG